MTSIWMNSAILRIVGWTMMEVPVLNLRQPRYSRQWLPYLVAQVHYLPYRLTLRSLGLSASRCLLRRRYRYRSLHLLQTVPLPIRLPTLFRRLLHLHLRLTGRCRYPFPHGRISFHSPCPRARKSESGKPPKPRFSPLLLLPALHRLPHTPTL